MKETKNMTKKYVTIHFNAPANLKKKKEAIKEVTGLKAVKLAPYDAGLEPDYPADLVHTLVIVPGHAPHPGVLGLTGIFGKSERNDILNKLKTIDEFQEIKVSSNPLRTWKSYDKHNKPPKGMPANQLDSRKLYKA